MIVVNTIKHGINYAASCCWAAAYPLERRPVTSLRTRKRKYEGVKGFTLYQCIHDVLRCVEVWWLRQVCIHIIFRNNSYTGMHSPLSYSYPVSCANNHLKLLCHSDFTTNWTNSQRQSKIKHSSIRAELIHSVIALHINNTVHNTPNNNYNVTKVTIYPRHDQNASMTAMRAHLRYIISR